GIRDDLVTGVQTCALPIYSFFQYAAVFHPEHAELIQRVLAIPEKRFDTVLVAYLTRPEIDALLASPDRLTWTGQRDYTLLLLARSEERRVGKESGWQCVQE